MRKKLFVVICILFVMLLISACSDNGKDDSVNATNDNESETSDYPDKTIEILVGFDAGGGTDVIARTAADILNKEGIVEQSFSVNNMPGAGGGLAIQELLKRSGDEYVLLSNPDYATPIWDEKVDADYSEFNLIAQLAKDSIVFSTSPDSKYNNIDDVLEALKDDPDSVSIGLGANRVSTEGYAWEQIAKSLDIPYEDLTIVPFDGGSDLMTALLGEHIDVAAIEFSTIEGQISSDKLKPLAVQDPERIDLLPDIPTLKESGVDYSYSRPRGIWAAGDISDDVIAYWEDTIKALVDSDAWKEDYIEPNHLTNEYKDSEAYSEMIEEKAQEFKEFSEAYSDLKD